MQFGCFDVTPELDRCSLKDLVEHDHEVIISRPWSGIWEVSPFEINALAMLVRSCRPTSLFEFGTFSGRTTRNLALNAPDARVRTIDLPPGESTLPGGVTVGMYVEDLIAEGRVEQLFGDSTTYDFSPYHGTVDFVFIDASHGFDEVVADSRTALAMTDGRRSIIVWHDYGLIPGVTRGIDHVARELPDGLRPRWIRDSTLAVLRRDGSESRA